MELHLIYGRQDASESNENYHEVVSTYESLSSRAKYHHRLLSQCTRQWKNEYLLGILESTKLNADGKRPIVTVDDIVILTDDQTKRTFWKICKVIELISGTDGNIRAAKIHLVADKGKGIFIRPLKLLVPLEIMQPAQADAANAVPAASNSSSHTFAPTVVKISSTHMSNRPKRNAAIIGEIHRKDVIALE